MAAPSRASGPVEARVPCPLCGAPIHPIAGRCKHCKADLSTLRGSRPAAAAALPPLVAPSATPRAPDPYTIAANGHKNAGGYPVPAAPVSPAQIAHAAAAYQQTEQPILPPRPTGRMPIAAPAASWKSWPVIVIVLAVIAIVTAVVLMVWPPGGTAEAGPATYKPMPAPERMDTSPLPPAQPSAPTAPKADPAKPDPWSNRAPTPPGHQQAPDIDDPDLKDPLANDPFSRRGGTLSQAGSMVNAVMLRACERMTQCPQIDASTKTLCETYAQLGRRMAPPTCPAMQRCSERIAELDCDQLQAQGLAALGQLLFTTPDCSEALNC